MYPIIQKTNVIIKKIIKKGFQNFQIYLLNFHKYETYYSTTTVHI